MFARATAVGGDYDSRVPLLRAESRLDRRGRLDWSSSRGQGLEDVGEIEKMLMRVEKLVDGVSRPRFGSRDSVFYQPTFI